MTREYDAQIGARIRELRTAKGWTQEELAARLQVAGCDISRSVLANLEAGLRHIYCKELKAFKEILAVSYDDLFV